MLDDVAALPLPAWSKLLGAVRAEAGHLELELTRCARHAELAVAAFRMKATGLNLGGRMLGNAEDASGEGSAGAQHFFWLETLEVDSFGRRFAFLLGKK